MSKANRIASYDPRMVEVALELKDRPLIELHLPSKREAEGLRFEFYGLRRAIKSEGSEGMFPEFMRAKLLVDGPKLRIGGTEALSPGFSSALDAALNAPKRPQPAPILHTYELFTPSLADAPPSSTYQPQAVVEEFENLIDAWMGSEPPK